MTSETKHEGYVASPFQNLIPIWQNYLISWIEVKRNQNWSRIPSMFTHLQDREIPKSNT
jgi:hypothetical protein